MFSHSVSFQLSRSASAGATSPRAEIGSGAYITVVLNTKEINKQNKEKKQAKRQENRLTECNPVKRSHPSFHLVHEPKSVWLNAGTQTVSSAHFTIGGNTCRLLKGHRVTCLPLKIIHAK